MREVDVRESGLISGGSGGLRWILRDIGREMHGVGMVIGVMIGCLTCGISGCAGPAEMRALVEVREVGTHVPVAGALVIAQSMNRDHPLSVDSQLGRLGPMESRDTTDERGLARVELVEGRLVRFSVVPMGRVDRGVGRGGAGCAMAFVNVETESPGDEVWGRWLPLSATSPSRAKDSETGNVGAGAMEIRIEPEGSR